MGLRLAVFLMMSSAAFAQVDCIEMQQSAVRVGTSCAPLKLNFSGCTVGKSGSTYTITCSTGGGSGTVTSFSAGDLAPLFTSSVATPTTTPAHTFNQSTFAAHTFYGNNTGSTAAPGAQSVNEADVTNLVSDLAALNHATNPFYPLGTSVTATSSVLVNTANKATVISMFIDRPVTTSQVTYEIGTTADNTADTYDLAVYTGTPGGTCTLVASLGPIAGTTFAPGASAYHTMNWTQGTVTIPAGRIYLLGTVGGIAAGPAAFFQAMVSNTQVFSTGISITTGGTAPGTFTCPADGTTAATIQGKFMWEKIW